jgi:flagellin-like hook-associated protein FlgL
MLFSGNGDGTFSAPSTVSDNRTLELVGDFNNDGILDILEDTGANVRVYAGDGAGNFSALGPLIPTTDSRFAAYDINEDGNLDLAGTDMATGAINIRLGNGDGTFQNAIALTAATDSYDLKFGDFNGDSSIDIAVSTYFNQRVAIYLGEAVRNPRMGEISLLEIQLARDTLTSMQNLQDNLSIARGNTGAYLSRLNTAANNMLTRRENTIAAAGRITDVDIAAEMAEYVRQRILQNAASSILSQANLQSSIALQLLK